MKKIASFILLVIVTAAIGIALVACNNATTQGQLVDAWKEGRPYERYTYTVDDSATEGTDGTYVSEIVYFKSYKAQSEIDAMENEAQKAAYTSEKVKVGDAELEQREGYLIRGTLTATLAGKEVKNVTECYFELTDGSSYLLPRATFRSESADGKETLRMNGSYYGGSLAYTLVAGGEESRGEIGLGSPYYDNNEFHQSLRGVSTFSSSFSFSFNTAIVNAVEQVSASLTFSVSGTENVTLNGLSSVSSEDGTDKTNTDTVLNCYRAALSRSTTVAGASQSMWYTVDPVYAVVTDGENGKTTSLYTYDNGKSWALPHVLAKFVEPYKTDSASGSVTYTLAEISLVPPQSEAE